MSRCLPVVALAVLVHVVAPAALEAQSCAEGRVAVDGGYCCWPGQSADLTTGNCLGPPSCPMGRVAAGADCVVSSGSVTSSPGVERPTRTPDWGLIGGGIALMSVGYLGALVTDIVMGQQSSSRYIGGITVRVPVVPNWWVGFFPLVHAAAAAGACTSCGSYDLPVIISGVIGAAMEIGGIAMLVVGILGNEVRTDVALGAGRLTLGAAGGPGGLSYDVRF